MSQAVVALVFHPYTGHILATTRRNSEDDWGLPGGKVDAGESPRQAIKREFREEVGVDVYNFGAFPYVTQPCTSKYGTFEVAAYRASVTNELMDKYGDGSIHEIEPGIKVGFVPVHKLLVGSTFADYNRDLISHFLMDADQYIP